MGTYSQTTHELGRKKMAPAKKAPSSKNLTSKTKKAKGSGLKTETKKSLKKGLKNMVSAKKGPRADMKKTVDRKSSTKANPNVQDLNQFIAAKFGKLEKLAFMKQNVAGTSNSSLSDLVKFNTTLAHSVYKVTDETSLETLLYALQPEKDVKDLNPAVAAAYQEVSLYRDLLMLGDLPTITQELRPYEWIHTAPTLSLPAQAVLMASFLGLAIKLTGKKPARVTAKVPGGKMRGRERGEVMAYLAIMMNITDAMALGNSKKKAALVSNIKKMHSDLEKIVSNF